MLKRMYSPVFIEKGVIRPEIVFKPGLNVILGKEDGENSIGKSSAMLAIDFAFGGNTYIKSDGVRHMGDHDIFFSFEFAGKEYHFMRNTKNADKVVICTKENGYQRTNEEWSKEDFVNWLKKQYHVDFLDLSFRLTLSSFFRIYGKDNYNELHPLRGIQGHGMQKSIDILVKLYDRYKDIAAFDDRLKEQKDKLKAYTEARKYDFVSKIVGGKTQYEDNVVQIRQLEMELDSLTETQVEAHTEEDIEKSIKKSKLKSEKLRLETLIEAKNRRIQLLNMSLEYGLYPTEADIEQLAEFFPEVNLRKLYEVEKYHQKLATILGLQFAEEKQSVEIELASLQEQLDSVQGQIKELGISGNLSKEFLDKHGELKGKIEALRKQNEAYLLLTELQDEKNKADEVLKHGIEGVLKEMQETINKQMKEYNDTLYREPRKAPNLTFNEYNSYTFVTPDDTGTGTNYKGMVIYDLAVLATSDLPAIAHDSLILKNVSDGSIDGIMKIYESFTKQIFIAFDKQDAYMPETQRILQANRVLKLSDEGSELYGESWNKEKRN